MTRCGRNDVLERGDAVEERLVYGRVGVDGGEGERGGIAG